MKQLGNKAELNDEFQDAGFASYSLARDLIRSVSTLSLPQAPYTPPSNNEISLQRSQARFKFNHLFVNPFAPTEHVYFVGKDFSVYSINLQSTTQHFSVVFKVPRREKSPVYVDDISLGFVQLSTNQNILIVADGQVFNQDLPELGGAPFTIVDCRVSKSGNIRCLATHVEDATFTSSNSQFKQPLNFVRESEGESDVSDTPQMEIGAQPKAVNLIKQDIHLISFAAVNSTNNEYAVESVKTLKGKSAMEHGIFDEDGEGFSIVSSSLFVPFGESVDSYLPKPSPSPSPSPSNKPPLSSIEAVEMVKRLSMMTSETADANPYSLDFMKGKVVNLDEDDEDDDEGGGSVRIGGELPNLYHYDSSAKPQQSMGLSTFSWVCLGALQVAKSGQGRFSSFGLKCGVDCCAFDVRQKADENEPISVEHVATFPALSYVQNGKRNRKFTTFDPAYRWACVAEYERFAYFYLNQLPKNTNHKSVHQIFEIPPDTGNVVGIQFLPNDLCLLLTTRDLLVIQLKEK